MPTKDKYTPVTVRMLARLRATGIALPPGATLRLGKLSAGMRARGLWSWEAYGPDGEELEIGSTWTMGTLLACRALETEASEFGTAIVPGKGDLRRLAKRGITS